MSSRQCPARQRTSRTRSRGVQSRRPMATVRVKTRSGTRPEGRTQVGDTRRADRRTQTSPNAPPGPRWRITRTLQRCSRRCLRIRRRLRGLSLPGRVRQIAFVNTFGFPAGRTLTRQIIVPFRLSLLPSGRRFCPRLPPSTRLRVGGRGIGIGIVVVLLLLAIARVRGFRVRRSGRRWWRRWRPPRRLLSLRPGGHFAHLHHNSPPLLVVGRDNRRRDGCRWRVHRGGCADGERPRGHGLLLFGFWLGRFF
jgi:hypothetical protein